tara:strand:- start:569 stop:1114 length:546 start_codon:yes stop_codon:yes gene_type:complete
MELGLLSSGDSKWIGFKPSIGIWETNGEQIELKHFILDHMSLKTGWIQIASGSAPDCHWDESLGKVGKQPSSDHRRGFQVQVYLKDGGWYQWQQNQVGVLQGFSPLMSAIFDKVKDNPDKVPVVKYLEFEVNSKGKGTTRVPKFEVVKWADYPKDAEEPVVQAKPVAEPPASTPDETDDLF